MTINLEFILNENSQYIKVIKDDYQPHEKRFFELWKHFSCWLLLTDKQVLPLVNTHFLISYKNLMLRKQLLPDKFE